MLPVTGEVHCVEVGERAAGHEEALAPHGEVAAHNAAELFQELELDGREDGGHLEGVGVGVEHAHDPIPGHANGVRRAVELVAEVRVRRVDRVLEHGVHGAEKGGLVDGAVILADGQRDPNVCKGLAEFPGAPQLDDGEIATPLEVVDELRSHGLIGSNVTHA